VAATVRRGGADHGGRRDDGRAGHVADRLVGEPMTAAIEHRRRGGRIVALVVSLVTVTVINVAVTAWVVARSERQFCAIVGTTVQAYRDAPPATEVGRTLQRNSETLYRDLGCE
jgi:hypothetical protein